MVGIGATFSQCAMCNVQSKILNTYSAGWSWDRERGKVGLVQSTESVWQPGQSRAKQASKHCKFVQEHGCASLPTSA